MATKALTQPQPVSRRCSSNQPEIHNVTHVHLDHMALTTAENLPAIRKGTKRSYGDISSESGSNEEPLTIDDALHALHKKLPAYDFLQYRDRLKAKGIRYAESIGGFDHGFYAETIGMEVQHPLVQSERSNLVV